MSGEATMLLPVRPPLHRYVMMSCGRLGLKVELANRVVPNPSQIWVLPLMVGTVGLGLTVSVPLLVAMPPGVVTEMVPVVPMPTVAVIWVVEFTTKLLAALPPMLTAVAPVNLAPVMVMVAEAPAEQTCVGVKEVIFGPQVDSAGVSTSDWIVPVPNCPE